MEIVEIAVYALVAVVLGLALFGWGHTVGYEKAVGRMRFERDVLKETLARHQGIHQYGGPRTPPAPIQPTPEVVEKFRARTYDAEVPHTIHNDAIRETIKEIERGQA